MFFSGGREGGGGGPGGRFFFFFLTKWNPGILHIDKFLQTLPTKISNKCL